MMICSARNTMPGQWAVGTGWRGTRRRALCEPWIDDAARLVGVVDVGACREAHTAETASERRHEHLHRAAAGAQHLRALSRALRDEETGCLMVACRREQHSHTDGAVELAGSTARRADVAHVDVPAVRPVGTGHCCNAAGAKGRALL
jgi:hypothetical protein